jgi:parvulin-like peptidyl-prolyl isomerase
VAKTRAQSAKPDVRASAEHRRRSAQADSERTSRILLLGGVAVAVAIAIGLIVFGWYQTQIKPLQKTVLQVGNTKYSLAQVERRMKLLRNQDPTYGSLGSTNAQLALPNVTFALLEREAKLIEAASELQITVSDEDIAAEVRNRGSLAADVEPTAYAAEFKKQVDNSGLKESEYVQMLKASLLSQRVNDYFKFFAPASEPQVHGQYIAFDDQNKAKQALQFLQSGEAPDLVATQLGAASSSGSAKVTPVDWTPRPSIGLLPKEIQDFLFGAQPNQLSDVLTVGSAYYIAQLLERDDNRALDDKGKGTVAVREMNKWLDALNTKLTIKNDFTTNDQARALNDIP